MNTLSPITPTFVREALTARRLEITAVEAEGRRVARCRQRPLLSRLLRG